MMQENFTRPERSFSSKEKRCQTAFDEAINTFGRAWHLCTPGSKMPELLFRTATEYATMMNFVAYTAFHHPEIKLITFELMPNHVHFILLGNPDVIRLFFNELRRKVQLWFTSCGRRLLKPAFDYGELIPINDLELMRKQIVYTNRNNFVIDSDESPYSYPYGANSCYFLPQAHRLEHQTLGDLSVRERREMFHARDANLPLNYWVTDGYVYPLSYCAISLGESFFRDTRHYFSLLSKDVELMKGIAEQLGEKDFYHSDELFSIAVRYSKENFATGKISELSRDQRFEIAKYLHYDCGASNEMVAQVLRIPVQTIQSLFPMRSK